MKFVVSALLLTVSAAEMFAATVTLEWDPSSSSDVTGYRVYYGVGPRAYTNQVTVGNVTNAAVSGLRGGSAYYFTATAFDRNGLESEYSNEVNCQTPLSTATITLAALSQIYDGQPKAATATTTPAGLPVALTYNGLPSAPTDAGNHTVVATIVSTEYTGSVTNTLTIAPANAGIYLAGLNAAYDGSWHPVTVTTVPAGLATAVTYGGSPVAPTNAGSYLVVASVQTANYSGSVSDTLVISKAPATVAVQSVTRVYNGKAVPATVHTTPSGLSVTVTYNGSTTVPTEVGSYTVTATVADQNYSGTAEGTLRIKKIQPPGNLNIAQAGAGNSASNPAGGQ